MNRGSAIRDAYPLSREVASMRPRFMNRGSRVVVLLGDALAKASMRPRFMNRGSRGYGQGRRGWHQGFNEAPIHESGKSGDMIDVDVIIGQLQ